MIFGGNTSDCSRNVEFRRGPQPYEYAHVAKQPGSNYKIRHRDAERARMARIQMNNEDYFKNVMIQARHQEVIGLADKKHVHNKIKKAVEWGMKANAHLYEEERPAEPKLESEPATETKEYLTEKPKISTILVDYNVMTDEEKRKFVEEKRLQMTTENSEEWRAAGVAERKRNISNLNYIISQDKKRIDQEQKIKKIELANLKNAEIIQMQALAKAEEQQKACEKKLRIREDLYKQVQKVEEAKNHQKELKKIEINECHKLIEELNEKEKLAKLNHIRSHEQRKKDIERFTVEKLKLYSNMNKAEALFRESLAETMTQNVKDDSVEEVEKKIRIKVENDVFLKKQAVIREEQRKQSEEKFNALVRMLNERNEFERSVEREKAEKRRKIMEVANRALMEQLKSRETYRKEQKDAKRKEDERSAGKHEEYLKRVKQEREEKLLRQAQFRKDLSDQIKTRNDSITR